MARSMNIRKEENLFQKCYRRALLHALLRCREVNPPVPAELWATVQPLLPRHKGQPGKRGRPPVDDRACLTGILLVIRTRIPWTQLPKELNCGSGITCWRRLRQWEGSNTWPHLLHALLNRSRGEGVSDENSMVLDRAALETFWQHVTRKRKSHDGCLPNNRPERRTPG
jgi:transposase